jgi:hypothetical protein
LRGEKITIEGDGSSTRDFNYVMNMVTAVITILERGPEIWDQTYNIGSGSEIPVLNIARSIRLMVGPVNPMGRPSEIEFLPWRAGEKGKRVSLSIEKAQKAFDYYPYVKTLDGIRNVIIWLAWYHENFDPERIEELRKRWPSGQAFEQEHKLGYSDISPERVDEYPEQLTPEQVERVQKVGAAGSSSGKEEEPKDEKVRARIQEMSDEAIEDYHKAIQGGS